MELNTNSPVVAGLFSVAVLATPVSAAYNGWAQRRAAKKQEDLAAAQAKLVSESAAKVAKEVEDAKKFSEAVALAVTQFQATADQKLDKIVGLVDGNMSEAKATIKELRTKLDEMEKLLGRVAPINKAY